MVDLKRKLKKIIGKQFFFLKNNFFLQKKKKIINRLKMPHNITEYLFFIFIHI